MQVSRYFMKETDAGANAIAALTPPTSITSA